MEFEKIFIDGKEYDYILSSDDMVETNDIDIEDTVDLTVVANAIKNIDLDGEDNE